MSSRCSLNRQLKQQYYSHTTPQRGTRFKLWISWVKRHWYTNTSPRPRTLLGYDNYVQGKNKVIHRVESIPGASPEFALSRDTLHGWDDTTAPWGTRLSWEIYQAKKSRIYISTTTYTKTQPTDSEYWDYTVRCTFLLYVYLLVRMNSNVIA